MGKSFTRLFVGGLVLLSLSACGATSNSLYDWNGYNRELLAYYKSPVDQSIFAEKLYEDIEKAEIEGRVPPGLYAEYGYISMQMGETDTAIIFFTKERDAWPEAVFLMDSVIRRLGGASPATEPAAEEKSEEGAGQ